jgi:hypothetical protein
VPASCRGGGSGPRQIFARHGADSPSRQDAGRACASSSSIRTSSEQDGQMGSNHSTVEHAFSLVANDRIRLLSRNDARGATGRVARLLQNSNACWFVRYALTLEA